MITEVTLPESKTPAFPARCVYSGASNPEAYAWVIVESTRPILGLAGPLLLSSKRRRLRVPIQKKHRLRFYSQIFGRDVLTAIFIVSATLYLAPMISRNETLRIIPLLVWLMAVLSPWLVYDSFVHRKLEVIARGGRTDYLFSSQDYAEDFARLNEYSEPEIPVMPPNNTDLLKQQALRAELGAQKFPYLMPIEKFLDGNDDEGSIGGNLLIHPGMAKFREILIGLLQRSDVEAIYAWLSDFDCEEKGWPFTDTLIVVGTISLDDVRSAVSVLSPDSIECSKPLVIPTRNEKRPSISLWWD